jgi:hypothetical protein
MSDQQRPRTYLRALPESVETAPPTAAIEVVTHEPEEWREVPRPGVVVKLRDTGLGQSRRRAVAPSPQSMIMVCGGAWAAAFVMSRHSPSHYRLGSRCFNACTSCWASWAACRAFSAACAFSVACSRSCCAFSMA